MISIFYHSIFSGGTIPVNTGYACSIMQEQMKALDDSGLLDEADEFHIGINGPSEDRDVARLFCPCPNARYVVHGAGATTEIPTLNYLRKWLPGHEDWFVMYHHLKAVTHPGEELYTNWRRRLEKAVVWNWRECVRQMGAGVDACGAHYLTPEQFPSLVIGPPFFGGTFWWATARYLLTLPPLPPATWQNRYEAEKWIGRGPVRPKVKDYCPGWP